MAELGVGVFEGAKQNFLKAEFSTDLGVMMTERDRQEQLASIRALKRLGLSANEKVDRNFMEAYTLRDMAKDKNDKDGKKKQNGVIVSLAEDKNCSWGRVKLSAAQLLLMKESGIKYGGVTTDHAKGMKFLKEAIDFSVRDKDEQTLAMVGRSVVRWAQGKDPDIASTIGKKTLAETMKRPEVLLAAQKALSEARENPGARTASSIKNEEKLMLAAWRSSPVAKMFPNVKTTDDFLKVSASDIQAAYAQNSPQTAQAKEKENLAHTSAQSLSRGNSRRAGNSLTL